MKKTRKPVGHKKPEGGRGRPTLLVKEVVDKVCQAIRTGNYFDTSCRFAGVAPNTVRGWLEKAEKEPETYPDCVEFSEALKKAEAEAEVAAVAAVRKQMPDNWAAAMTYLERRYPDRWRRRESVDVGEGDKPMRVIFGGRYRPKPTAGAQS